MNKTKHMPWCISACLTEPNQDDDIIIICMGGRSLIASPAKIIMNNVITSAAVVNTFIERMVGAK